MIIAIISLSILCLLLVFISYKLYQKNQSLLRFEVLDEQLIELKNTNATITEQLQNLSKENGMLQGKLKTEDQLKEYMQKEFKNTSSDILRVQTDDFQKLSSEKLDSIIKPFKENINKFETTIKGDFEKLNRDIVALNSVSTKVSEQANNLADALKGNKKIHGDWGEKILVSVLESSGLQRGRDFTVQEHIHGEEKNLRPDVVINLPDDRYIFVDSKFSLQSYIDFYNAKTEEEKLLALAVLMKNTKGRISELTKYFDQKEKNIPEVIFMFVPLDFISILIDEDDAILTEAWNKKIAIVAPNTLLSSLKIVDYLWKMDKQNKNTQEVIKIAEALYNQFFKFNESLKDIEKGFNKTKEAFDDSIKRAESGRGNLLSGFEKIREVGGISVKETLVVPRKDTVVNEKDLLS